MPAHNHSMAPKFRPDQPCKLHRYFDELRHLFNNCQINSNEDKKKYVIRYLEIDSADLYLSIKPHTPMTTLFKLFSFFILAQVKNKGGLWQILTL
jgi:hypothetical protein